MRAINLIIIAACAVALVAAKPLKGGYGVGDTVSDFKLKNFDGTMVSLADYGNAKGVILIFDCNTCPYSQAYNDRIIALHKAYGPKGFPVITINANDGKLSPGDSFEKMVARASEKSYDFPYLLDDSQRVAKAFGATNTPHTFVLRREGTKFVVSYIGAIDNNPQNGDNADRKYVEEAVDALLESQPVSTPKTKAVGCGIKWRKS